MKSFINFLLKEGVNDPAIFKAVFMAGGPGSGKSFIAGKTGLTSMGLVLINSDDIFEALLAKAGLETTPTEDTSLERNRMRARTLPDKEVSKMWSHVQANIGAFQRLFKGRLVIVDNSKGKNADKETLSAYKIAVAWIKKSPSRRSAAAWIANEKKRRGITK